MEPPSSAPSRRITQSEALLDELGQSSAFSVLLSQAIADSVGIHPTDLEALDLLRRNGPLSTGRLAELTGLSTGGAITALIDRLERVGYVRREPDPSDRRRVLIAMREDRAERALGPLYAELIAAMLALLERYGDAELDLILDFTTRANQITAAHISRVRRRATDHAAAPVEQPP